VLAVEALDAALVAEVAALVAEVAALVAEVAAAVADALEFGPTWKNPVDVL